MSKGYMYAHIPGGGPAGATCGGCNHLARKTWQHQRLTRAIAWCRKAADLAGVKSGRALAPTTPACKYWEARPCA